MPMRMAAHLCALASDLADFHPHGMIFTTTVAFF
jgi:hypothetical protein